MDDKEFSFENLIFQQSHNRKVKEPVNDTPVDSDGASEVVPTKTETLKPKNVPVIPPEIFMEDVPENSRMSSNKPTGQQAERFDEPGFAGGYEIPNRPWGSYEQTQEALKQRDTVQWKLIHGSEQADFLEPESEPQWVITEWVYWWFPWFDKRNK